MRPIPDEHRLPEQNAYRPIGDYAIIGNSRSAALVSRDGSIDWLCLPRFDSPSTFAALLDHDKGGRFQIQPVGSFEAERRYIGDTNVLETTFITPSGRFRLTDLMPVASEEEKRRQFWPDHEILRMVECIDGEVELQIACDPRPDYGREVPRLKDRGALGIVWEDGPGILSLHSEVPLGLSPAHPGVGGRITLCAGEHRYLSLAFNEEAPGVLPVLGRLAGERIAQSLRWWQTWSQQSDYDGPYRDAIMRSALVLKLLAFSPSGAIIAAPTTSLPESIGGTRNWDYRFCWLRDASLTLRALFDVGCVQEGEAFLAWLLHATHLTWPELQVVYDVHGESRLPESELNHLEGYRSSKPIRIGNDAHHQLQLDVYGEVIDAAFQFVRRGGRLDRRTGRLLVELGETVSKRWREPDEGIWEIRTGRRQHTVSKALCWLALDRLITLAQINDLAVPVDRFMHEQAAIREAIDRHGYNEQLGSYVSVFDSDEVDASLLLLGLLGFEDASTARMRRTTERVRQQLERDGLLYRYLNDDGLPPGEGAFGICSFWSVEIRARQGDVPGATAAFERLLSHANDVGLFGEEIDPATGAVLGNFPQAFTHIGLINAALTLAAQTGRQPERDLAGRESSDMR